MNRSVRFLLVALLVACSPSERKDSAPPLEDYGDVPAFALRDQTGAELTEAWLRGKVTIVDFIFTRCDTICPALSLKFARLEEQTKDLGDEVQLLSFSVDPAYDTPEVLAAYAAKFDADPARWRFVTGEPAAIERLVTGPFMTAMDRAGTTPSGAPDIRHGGHFLLVGPDLTIRGVYDSNDPPRLEAVAKDARRLATAPAPRGSP